jgi:hypothetical protein
VEWQRCRIAWCSSSLAPACRKRQRGLV